MGTGLLIGTGLALKTAGPGAILVAYGAIGFVVYMVMTALGEIASFIPLPGFANYGKRYADEALGFACGIVYLIKYLVLPANQLTAGALTMQYWVSRDRVNPGFGLQCFLLSLHSLIFLVSKCLVKSNSGCQY